MLTKIYVQINLLYYQLKIRYLFEQAHFRHWCLRRARQRAALADDAFMCANADAIAFRLYCHAEGTLEYDPTDVIYP